VLLMVIHLALLVHGRLSPREDRLALLLSAAWAAHWLLATLAPRRYVAVRTPLIWTLRLVQGALDAYLYNTLSFWPAASAAHTAPAATLLGSLGEPANAVAALSISNVFLPGYIIDAFGMQLPPGQHLAHALLCNVLLGARAVPGKLWPVCCEFAERRHSTCTDPSVIPQCMTAACLHCSCPGKSIVFTLPQTSASHYPMLQFVRSMLPAQQVPGW
jgi:hypothetical protein